MAALLMMQASHWLVHREEQKHLGALAQRVLERGESAVAEATHALRAVRDLAPQDYCTARGTERFSQVMSRTHRLRAVGGLTPDNRACSSAGARSLAASLPAPRWIGSDYSVWLHMGPELGLPEGTVVIALGSVFAAIDPFFLVDAVAVSDVQVALLDAANGEPLATTPGADLSRMSAARLSEAVVEPGHETYVSRRHAWAPAVVVVSQTRISHLEQWRNEAWLWVPLGVIFGGLGGLAATAVMRQAPEAALRRALVKRAFVVFYQPIVELATGRCAGAEALVRWRRPDGTLLRPDLFIPLAEETGLVLALTDQVLENVVTELGALLRSEPVYVSINLSARDVASTRILGLAGRLLGAAQIPPDRIAFEVTERGAIDAGNARPALRRYHDAGHRILIDDFGTGYSSLAQLQSLEVDAIKIDKSFIDLIGTAAAMRSVVPDIVQMARTLELELVVEGVESESQAAYLRAHGVAYGQGDLFGKPMPVNEFLRYIAGRGAASSSDG